MSRGSTKRRIAEQAVDWALRLSDGDLLPDEHDALRAWTRDERHAEALRRATAVLGNSRSLLRADPDFSRANFGAHDRSAAKIIVSIALVTLLCLGYLFGLPARFEADIVTNVNETRTVSLPDGSKVHLNGDSALAEDFDPSVRRVRLLKGQAYFEVAKDPARPFVVEAGNGQAEALGTAFDVNLVDDHSEVTVVESHVRVSAGSERQQAVLEPGERIAYGSDGKLGEITRVSAGLEAPWVHDRLVFEERPLSAVVEEMFRRLPGKVIIANSATGHRRISGFFDLKDPQAAFKSFSDAMNLRVVKAGKLLTVIY